MKNELNLSALATILDTTFGRSSTPLTASYSVKVSIVRENLLDVSYGAVVNFGTEREMIRMKMDYADEARSVVKAHLKEVKRAYKELTGDSIRLTERDPVDSLEVVNFNVINPKRTCVYHSKCLVEIS